MKPKKRRRGDVSFNVVYDIEDETLMDYMWDEDREQPPLIKPPKKKDAEKKRRPS